ncbi:hypothetical protein DSL64_08390 [Dyadobacter luteus]|uniref:Uncharacterized protein n=1 Tax=Dyadobacter luteus TaxID=2259619 RepID=A0A3D8YEH6_9BACT|nr:DUF5958 family protein [Dyadobacter luteus]REA62920.1 hypothetical protein DSL64_08390 [Dyadobacter luteus]
MRLEDEIAINQFAQSVRSIDDLLASFSNLEENSKRTVLGFLCNLIWQSKPVDSDVRLAIEGSALKPTFTPCVLLLTHRLVIGLPKVIDLPDSELRKSYILLLHLFKIAYLRRFEEEKGFSEKWWYADLSDIGFVKSLLTTGD